MPRRRTSRRSRKGAPPRAVGVPAAPRPVQPSQAPAAAPKPDAPPPAPEPSVTGRLSARDYGYVRRELVRIAVLASAIIATIVVLSFFLP